MKWKSSILQCFVCTFKKDALARVKRFGFLLCDVEESSVKSSYTFLKIVCPFILELVGASQYYLFKNLCRNMDLLSHFSQHLDDGMPQY